MLLALLASAAVVALTPINATPSRALPLTPPASPPAPPPTRPPPALPPDLRADLKAVLHSVMRTESAIQVAWASDLAECRERLEESDLSRLRGLWMNIAVGVLCILWAAMALVAANVFLALRLRRIASALTNGTGAAVKARLLANDRDGVEEEEEDVHAGKRSAAAKASAKAASGVPVEAVMRSCRTDKRSATPATGRPGGRGGEGRGGESRAGTSRAHARRRTDDGGDEQDALYE